MKTNKNRLFVILASILIAFSVVSETAAQPGGCFRNTWRWGHCKDQRDQLLQKLASEIEHLDQLVTRQPATADHYYRRGQVYSRMLISHFGVKDVEFDDKVYFSAVDEKAIVDYTRAIQLLPKAEYFTERGKIHLYKWEGGTSNFQYVSRDEKTTDDEIRQTVDKLFIYNEIFQAAERDFLKGIELSGKDGTSKEAREGLFALRSRRGNSLSLNESVAKLVGAERPGDVALGDFDYVIDFYSFLKANINPNDTIRRLLYDAWIQKGAAAKRFGRDDIALEAFSKAEKARVENSYPDCALYQNRAEIFLKRTNFEAALKDVTFAIDNNLNCKRMSELRGDIYLAQGDLTAAIDSYSIILNEGNGFNRDTYWKRGKVYLQINEAQKAINDFTAAIGYSSLCEKDYQLRAVAYRLAGDTQAAEADEQRARQALKDQNLYQSSDYCYYHKP